MPTTNGSRGHRVEVVQGSQHVKVTIDGLPVAESDRPLLVYETGMPVRYYLPPQDVDLASFTATDTRTHCPFKGDASYWTFTGGPEARADVVWAYEKPIDSVAAIEGHLSFYDSVAEITVDGAPAGG